MHVWAFPLRADGSLGTPAFLGAAPYGGTRPDVGAAFGAQFTNSAYWLQTSPLPTGTYRLVVYAHSTVSNTFNDAQAIDLTVAGPAMSIDGPLSGTTQLQPFLVSGWAIDQAAASGSGVDAIHIWAFPVGSSSGGPTFAGVGSYGAARGDVGAAFGSQFTNSGYNTYVTGLPSGTYDLFVFAHSVVTGTFNQARVVQVTVR